MQSIVQEVPRPPSVLELAACLRDGSDFALLLDATGTRATYLACDAVETADAIDPEPNLELGRCTGPLSRVPRWIGMLPYECRRELERSSPLELDRRPEPELSSPLWCRYRAVVEVTDKVRVVGDDAKAVARLVKKLESPSPAADYELFLNPDQEPASCHELRVQRALAHIERGDLYQVNLARRFGLTAFGHPLDGLRRLGNGAKTAHAAALRFGNLDIVSTSPELFLELLPDGQMTTVPIKGTRPRGATPDEDLELEAELEKSEKERAELNMVIDVERNDLGRIAEVGSVRLEYPPRVERFPTVLHRLAAVSARLRSDVSRSELLCAMLPSGSITGAPKVRAMETIAALESRRRGVYTGAYGSLSHAGALRLSMAIRVIVTRNGRGCYWAGGGIVADSNPSLEVEETTWKARQLASLLARAD